MKPASTAFAARPGSHRIRALAREVAAAEARERERIAGGLHDEFGPLLALMGMKLGELRRRVDGDGLAAVEELRSLVAQVAEATRHATFELCSPVLRQQGLQAAIEGLAQRMGRSFGLDVVLRGGLAGLPPAGDAQVAVFRVVRELLHNVHKHARASQAVVELAWRDGMLQVEVMDDGVGFDPASDTRRFSAQGGYGLRSAEAQVSALGGTLALASAAGRGTRARLAVPLFVAVRPRTRARGWRRRITGSPQAAVTGRGLHPATRSTEEGAR